MIDRITTMMVAQNTLNDLELSYQRLTNTEEELSSGKQIQEPSDNPYGMSLILQQQDQLGLLTQYQTNINDGTAWSQASTTALSNISNVVQRVRELTVEAANGTNTQDDLNADASEVQQLIEEVKQEANTQYDGQYIFSGTANVPPYQTATGDVYQGNSGSAAAVTRLIGPNTSVQVNADLSSILGNGSQGPSGPDGLLLNTLNNIYQDMTTGNTSGLQGTDLTDLDNNFNSLTQMEASLGATQDRLQLATSRVQDLQTADTQVLSSTQDADMAQTEINYSTEQAAYTAALKAGAGIVQSSLMDFLSSSG